MSNDNNEKPVPPNNGANGEGSEPETQPTEPQQTPRRKGRKPAGKENQSTQEVLGLLSDVADDISGNSKDISGVIVICSWKDGSLTQGWTGNFDLDQTSGKLFNIATQFTLNSIRIKSMN